MTSADFCTLNRFFRSRLPPMWLVHRSPRVIAASFHSMHPSHLLSIGLGHKDFVLPCKLIHLSLASYELICVPRVGILSTASFRFHLTMDTLAVQLMTTAAFRHSGLSPYRPRPCRAHMKSARPAAEAICFNQKKLVVAFHY
jgi:hypothetical protein